MALEKIRLSPEEIGNLVYGFQGGVSELKILAMRLARESGAIFPPIHVVRSEDVYQLRFFNYTGNFSNGDHGGHHRAFTFLTPGSSIDAIVHERHYFSILGRNFRPVRDLTLVPYDRSNTLQEEDLASTIALLDLDLAQKFCKEHKLPEWMANGSKEKGPIFDY